MEYKQLIILHIERCYKEALGVNYRDVYKRRDNITSKIKHTIRSTLIDMYGLSLTDYAALESIALNKKKNTCHTTIIKSVDIAKSYTHDKIRAYINHIVEKTDPVYE